MATKTVKTEDLTVDQVDAVLRDLVENNGGYFNHKAQVDNWLEMRYLLTHQDDSDTSQEQQ